MTSSPTATVAKSTQDAIVVFMLDEQEFGLRISAVERVVRVVEITPLPEAPDGVLGVVNVQGDVIPVFDPRSRFHLPARVLRLSDHLIVAHSRKRKVALIVDRVVGVLAENRSRTVDAETILPHLDYVEEVIKAENDLILIHNLDTFLSGEEETSLHAAIGSQPCPPTFQTFS